MEKDWVPIIDIGEIRLVVDDLSNSIRTKSRKYRNRKYNGLAEGAAGIAIACHAWGISEYSNWDKLGLPDSNISNPDNCCGEGSGVFNTPCPNCSASWATYCSKKKRHEAREA